MRDGEVEPFFAGRRVARVVRIDQRDVELACLDRRQDPAGEDAVSS